jgi:hypothetical protein
MASDSNFTQQALETVETATFKLRTDTDNVAGVLLPVFKVDFRCFLFLVVWLIRSACK